MPLPKRYHVQYPVDMLIGDKSLEGLLVTGKGKKLTPGEARAALRELKEKGYEVVPCECKGAQEPPGKCPGF